VDKAANCTYTGTKSYHCALCGVKLPGTEVTIPTTNHNPSAEYVIAFAPTQTTPGQKYKVCTTCGCVIEETIVDIPPDPNSPIN